MHFLNFVEPIQLLLPFLCTSCTAERSFSALKRVKTYLRSTMIQDRLERLVQITVERKLLMSLQSEIIIDKHGTVSAKIAPRLKCYKNASRLNRYNVPTDNAIDFLFSTLHTTPFHLVIAIQTRCIFITF